MFDTGTAPVIAASPTPVASLVEIEQEPCRYYQERRFGRQQPRRGGHWYLVLARRARGSLVLRSGALVLYAPARSG